MRKIFLITALIFLSASCHSQKYNYSHRLKIGTQTLAVEIVSDPLKMQQGLSGRQSMKENEGMLFDYNGQKQIPKFWMKDMKFDLDLIWIADGKLIGITPNVPHSNSQSAQLPTYSPTSAVDMVLEVNAGWTEKNKISINGPISFE